MHGEAGGDYNHGVLCGWKRMWERRVSRVTSERSDIFEESVEPRYRKKCRSTLGTLTRFLLHCVTGKSNIHKNLARTLHVRKSARIGT